MTLLRPEWLLAWPLIGLVVWQLRRQAVGRWQRHIDHELLEPLLGSPADRRGRLLRGTGLMALLLLPLGLAGPAIEINSDEALQERPAVIVLDLSPTMLGTDVSPNRHTRARQKVQDWLAAHPGRPAALVAYSGTAHVVTPMTFDHNTVNLMLRQLHPEMMPQPGSHPVAALQLAKEQLAGQPGDLLWLTDSLTAEQRTALPELPPIVEQLGIILLGTDVGAPALRGDGTPLRDAAGNLVEPTLDTTQFSILAEHDRIRWHPLRADDSDWETVLSSGRLTGDGTLAEAQTITRDLGPWLLLALLPGLLILYGRGQLMVLPLALGLSALWSPAEASGLDWLRSPDQQGAARLPDDPAAAMDLFRSRDWRVYAALEAGEYRRALQWLEPPRNARDHYHRGNALVHLERFEEALEAYDEALALDADFAEAQQNRDLVARFLERLEQAGDRGEPNDATPGPADSAGGGIRGEGAPALPGDSSGDGGLTDPGAKALDDSIRQRLPEQDASFLERKFLYQYRADPDNVDTTGPSW